MFKKAHMVVVSIALYFQLEVETLAIKEELVAKFLLWDSGQPMLVPRSGGGLLQMEGDQGQRDA